MIIIRALKYSRNNRAFADHLLLAIMIEMLLPDDKWHPLDPDLELNSYGGRYGDIDLHIATVGSKVSQKELDAIADAIREAHNVQFKDTTHLLDYCKDVFGLVDCQCVEAIHLINWENPVYRHNIQK